MTFRTNSNIFVIESVLRHVYTHRYCGTPPPHISYIASEASAVLKVRTMVRELETTLM